MDRPVVEAHCHHADALAVLHDQVEREIFDVEVRVILQALLIERVEHGVAGAVGGGAGALHSGACTHVLHVAAEGTLIDRAVVVAREGNACVLQFVHGLRRFAGEIFNRVLVAQPVRPLHGVVHVPSPVVGRIVAEARRDPALRCDSVRARGEDLGDVRGAKPCFGCAHGCAQTCAACADDHDVISVVDNLVRALQTGGFCGACHQAAPVNARLATLKIANAPPPMAARLSAESSANFDPDSWT